MKGRIAQAVTGKRECVIMKSNAMKPIKNEISTAVTVAKADEQSLDKSKEVLEEVQAPLACEESDPAPLASLESANSSDLQSM